MIFRNKPCQWKKITQGFSSSHKGIDFANGQGTPIYAVAPGKVVAASYGAWDSSYGNMVAIDHGGGNYTNYAHLSKISVKAGQAVSAGQQIGEMGSTGNSTGSHLHFELHSGKKWNRVNPKPYIDAIGSYIAGQTYTLQANMNVRSGPGTNYPVKQVSELTADGRKHATKSSGLATLKKGTVITCLETDGDWMRIPSGWICCRQGSEVYIA